MSKYVVAGVTGRVGSTVADELLNRGATVTVIVRREAQGVEWARRGADIATGSLDDRSFLAQIAAGTAGLFTLLPENVPPDEFHEARRRMADAVAAAVRDSGVPHVVLLSALAAVLPDGNGPAKDLHYYERRLAANVQRLTILRACYFQDNVATVVPAAVHGGVNPNLFASADAPIPMIATRDIGRFAAQALITPPPGCEIVDLLGPMYSIRQLARELALALGKEVRVLDIPPERHRDSLVEAGIPQPIADAIAEMFAAFNAGLITPQGVRQLIGTTPVNDVIRQYIQPGAAPTTA